MLLKTSPKLKAPHVGLDAAALEPRSGWPFSHTLITSHYNRKPLKLITHPLYIYYIIYYIIYIIYYIILYYYILYYIMSYILSLISSLIFFEAFLIIFASSSEATESFMSWRCSASRSAT